MASYPGGPVSGIVETLIELSAANDFYVEWSNCEKVAFEVALGCSLAFPTPIGHPVNIIAMGSGGYTFKDFFRVGWLVTVLLFPAILLGLHWFWGL